MDKIKLTGVSETLLVPLYARYLESKRKKPQFIDKTAIKVADSLDYDFSKHKAKMNMWGCSARTIIIDREVKEYIALCKNATIINIACGLDDRFSRVDNGSIKWYNIDLENVIAIRNELIEPHDRVINIASSVFDYEWMDQIEDKSNVLIIAEGILMYFDECQVKELFDMVAEKCTRCTLICEIMSEWMVKNQKIHPTTHKTGATFKWGIKKVADFSTICPQFTFIEEFNLTNEMVRYSPLFITLISPMLKSKNNKIGYFIKS